MWFLMSDCFIFCEFEFYFEFKLSIDQSMPLMAFQFENVKLLSLVPSKI